MTTHPMVLVVAAAVVGLFAGLAFGPDRTHAQTTTYGYSLANSSSEKMVWRIDISNGRVSQCRVRDASGRPHCSAWSE